ncbi:NAD-dependent epimerase/dehydratase family protein [Sphingobium terrigena]|uniref:NAD-dependent epimerase/dehydratase family protein n=1 Tax=Sphingobium terrigena TaxID=2304063 RepID=A0A418YY33_9SPHN|nr:NAD-dependent epimerase/dehydratase family protein [Sphingobium terrigena]RJG57732.1 NAD-dependent epimerase/dehydratase family protein [Sphingobium terrigena]
MPRDEGTKKSVIVLGGTGFIGIKLLNQLVLDQGVNLHWIKRKKSCSPDIPGLPEPHIVEDFENIDLSWLSQADVIIDLVSQGRARATQHRDINKRIRPHLRIIDGLLNNRSHIHYIYLSSGGAIYGNTALTSLNEQSPCNPQTEYGLEKMIVETSLLSAAQNCLDVSILRISNAYGQGQTIKPGFGVIPTMISALKNGSAFTVLGNGEMQRDYVNVIDVQRAITAAVRAKGAGIVNIATGHGTSINQLIAMVETLSGRELNKISVEADVSDPDFARLDISRAKNVLQWQPTIRLEDGLSEILQDAGLMSRINYSELPHTMNRDAFPPAGTGAA